MIVTMTARDHVVRGVTFEQQPYDRDDDGSCSRGDVMVTVTTTTSATDDALMVYAVCVSA